MDLTPISDVLARQLAHTRSHPWKEEGNKYQHGLRTAKLALKLRKALFPENAAEDQLLTVASWFHDLCNDGQEEHWLRGAEKTRLLLQGLCAPEELDEICRMIGFHDIRDHNPDYSSSTLLLQDADLLDHFGTYDIWFTFRYAMEEGMNLEDTARWLLESRQKEKQPYYELLNFPLSREIYLERFDYEMDFAQRMFRELQSECLGFPQLEELE